jgi:ApbE superfamily uncharacterized protein (UPF0280 family)
MKYRIEIYDEKNDQKSSRVETVEASDEATAVEEVVRRMRSAGKRADVTPFVPGSSVLDGSDKLSG